MGNKSNWTLVLEELRTDAIIKSKKGLHFIIASVFIWAAILAIHLLPLPILTKNMFTFCCSAPLVPLAYGISKLIGVDFQNRENPLTKLGILFALNQMLYILIVMWVYAAEPEKMLMVYAMVFGAHLLPFGWLYRSKAYYVLSIVIPFGVLILGLYFVPAVIAGVMLVTEVGFCCLLWREVKKAEP